jgi:signal transduction histidine kinase
MRLPRSVRIYILAVLAIGLGLVAFSLQRFPLGGSWLRWFLLLVFVLLVGITDRFGLRRNQAMQVHLDTIPIFAGVLLFTPAEALIVAGMGRVVGRIDRPVSRWERAFNIGQTIVYTGAGALVLHVFAATPWVPGSVGSWLGLALCIAVMYLLNTGIVAGIVAVQHHIRLLSVWVQGVPLDLPEQSMEFGLGLLTALVVWPYPWALALIALPSWAVFVTLDRTLKMEARQAELARTNADLAEHLGKQAEQLRDAYAVLQDAMDAKNQMLQNVSHELRTPLFSVSGYAEALHDGLYGKLLPEQLPALEVIGRSAQKMIRLVNDLLALQALDRSQLLMSRVDLPALLADCVDTFGQRAVATGVRLNATCHPDVPILCGDCARLAQVISNVLDNAIKFSPDGGEVSLSAAAASDGRVRIAVSDHGIGIPADQLPRIYDRFYQVDNSMARRFDGQGLGLSIARRIVELHNGTIEAESEVGMGTTFYITLPVQALGPPISGEQVYGWVDRVSEILQ